MASEFFGWLQDLRGYVTFGVQRALVPLVKGGVDYQCSHYKDTVRKVVERIHPSQMALTVEKVIKETPTTKTFRFSRTDGPIPPFRPGQYVNLFVEIDGVKTSRPLSISSAPGEDFIDLTLRLKPGGFVSSYLYENVKMGDTFLSTGPAGSFYHEPLIDGKDLVFIAGGSGITPFMSILNWAKTNDWPFKVNLLYGNREEKDVIFADALGGLCEKTDALKFATVISEPKKGYKGPKGFIDAKMIQKQVGDVEGKTFYMCGPNAMYDFVQPELEKLGVPRHKIKRELYGPPDDVVKQPGWPKKISPDKKFSVKIVGRQEIPAVAGEPLMNSLERAGQVVPALCRSGECSLCRTRLISGKVFMPENVGLREADRESGYIHPCVTFPISDLVIRIEG